MAGALAIGVHRIRDLWVVMRKMLAGFRHLTEMRSFFLSRQHHGVRIFLIPSHDEQAPVSIICRQRMPEVDPCQCRIGGHCRFSQEGCPTLAA
jgi:hypothetical protein